MHLKSLTSNWESLFYTDPDYIVTNLNNNTYKVIEQPIKIYELW